MGNRPRVLAFLASSLMTYVLYIGRPQEVVNVTRLKAARLPSDQDVSSVASRGPTYFWIGRRREGRRVGGLDLVPIHNDVCNRPNENLSRNFLETTEHNTEMMKFISRAIVGCCLWRCALHCLISHPQPKLSCRGSRQLLKPRYR